MTILLLSKITINGQTNSNLLTTNFVSLAIPQDYQGLISYLDFNNFIVQRKVTDVKHDNSILSSFPNLVSSVTLYQVDEN